MLALHWLVNMLAGPAQARPGDKQHPALAALAPASGRAAAVSCTLTALPLKRATRELSCTAAARCWVTACSPSFCFRVPLSCCRRGARAAAQRPASRAPALNSARHPTRNRRRGATVCTLGVFATLWSSSTASSLLCKIVPALEVRCGLRAARATVTLRFAARCCGSVCVRCVAGATRARCIPLLLGLWTFRTPDARMRAGRRVRGMQAAACDTSCSVRTRSAS
jgi:hypothetical protein